MKKTVMVAALSIVLAVGSSLAVAGPRGGGPGMGSGHGWGNQMGSGYGWNDGRGSGPMMNDALAALKLTDEQNAKVQEVRLAFQKEQLPLHNELYGKRAELRTMWLEPSPDQEAILAKQGEISALEGKLAEALINHRFAMRAILTPEQLAQVPAIGSGMGNYQGRRMAGRW